jgi:hypothetical protein
MSACVDMIFTDLTVCTPSFPVTVTGTLKFVDAHPDKIESEPSAMMMFRMGELQ